MVAGCASVLMCCLHNLSEEEEEEEKKKGTGYRVVLAGVAKAEVVDRLR